MILLFFNGGSPVTVAAVTKVHERVKLERPTKYLKLDRPIKHLKVE